MAARQPLILQVMAGQWQVSVRVDGNADDPAGLGGFAYIVTDTDPARTALVAQARDAQAQAGAAQAAAAGNWNLVQTLETAADVSLQIAAQPEGSRTKLTERFMHKAVKHDITVDPNTVDPFASFSDHSKGEDVIGSIVEAVVGVVINVLAVIPVTAPIAAPLAVAWDTAQAGKNFAEGNVLGGFLSLASAVGVGLSGLGAIGEAAAVPGASSFASEAGDVASGVAKWLGFVDTPAAAATAVTAATPFVSATTAAANFGAGVLAGAALVGGAAGIAQSAAGGDALGIAAGALEVAAAVAGGLVDLKALSGAAKVFAQDVTAYGGLASVGLSSADAFARGDLAGGLSSSLQALLPLIAKAVQKINTPDTPAAGGGGGSAAAQGGSTQPVTGTATGQPQASGDDGSGTPANPYTEANNDTPNMRTERPLFSGGVEGETGATAADISVAEAAAEKQVANAAGKTMVEVGVAKLEGSVIGRLFLRYAFGVAVPEVGTVMIAIEVFQALVDSGALPTGPAPSTNVAGYDGTTLGRQSINLEVNPATGKGLLYNVLSSDGTVSPDQHGAVLSIDANGVVTNALGEKVGTYANSKFMPANGVDLPGLIRDSPVINSTSPLAQPPQPGYGIMTNNQEEVGLVAEMTAQKATPQQIQIALDNLRVVLQADPARAVVGRGYINNPVEIANMVRTMTAAGVVVMEREGQLSYNPGTVPGKPGQIIIDPSASYSAWLHEYQHFLDDQAAGWSGLRVRENTDVVWQREQNAYNVEINLMRSQGHNDVVTQLEANMEALRKELYQ